jgi:hypothetical protein
MKEKKKHLINLKVLLTYEHLFTCMAEDPAPKRK